MLAHPLYSQIKLQDEISEKQKGTIEQSSVQTAVLVAREVSRENMSDKDVLINIDAPVQEQKISISGGSAGALAVMVALQGKTLRNDVLITGTIKEDHTMGRIGVRLCCDISCSDRPEKRGR